MINQYLQRYAVEESTQIPALTEALDQPPWDAVLVIPAYAENYSSLAKVARLAIGETGAGNVLQIWVVNAPDNTSSDLLSQTENCWQQCVAHSRLVFSQQNLHLRRFDFGDVLLIDRFSERLRLPSKQGVGLARKVGGDCALALFALGRIKRSWLWYSDADAQLPENYFSQIQHQTKEIVAVIYRHIHVPEGDDAQQTAMGLYQAKLDLHVEGLKRAGSPYAYHSIGSTIACHFEGYVKVRGMPCRSGGEDFYLLNKLAKVGGVVELKGSPIQLSGRLSPRVPFGTGPALRAALGPKPGQTASINQDAMTSLTGAIQQYHPLIYELLGLMLATIPDLWPSRSNPEAVLASLVIRQGDCLSSCLASATENNILADKSREELAGLSQLWMDNVGLLDHLMQLLSRSRDQAAFCRHFHCWFDAFKTLKFIHWWREQGLYNLPIELAETEAYSDLLES